MIGFGEGQDQFLIFTADNKTAGTKKPKSETSATPVRSTKAAKTPRAAKSPPREADIAAQVWRLHLLEKAKKSADRSPTLAYASVLKTAIVARSVSA